MRIIRKGSHVTLDAYGVELKAQVLQKDNKVYCTIQTEPFYDPINEVYLRNGKIIGGVKISELTKQNL